MISHRSPALVFGAFLLLAFARCSAIGELYRSGAGNRYVTMVAGPVRVDFDTHHGGAPLDMWYTVDGQEYKILSPEPKPGTGFQLVYETGQDSTQAGANIFTEFRIARTDDPTTVAAYNYYCRESLPPNWPEGCNYYRVSGFAPFFWGSLDPIDDSRPPLSSGAAQDGWLVIRDNGQWDGQPLWFKSQPSRGAGILFVGDEMKPLSIPWNERLCEIPEGRFACRMRISFAETGPWAIAGIMFRRAVPSLPGAHIDHAYNSPGYFLNLDYAGNIQIVRVGTSGAQAIAWASQLDNAALLNLRGDTGVALELRTFNYAPEAVEVIVNGNSLVTYSDSEPLLGPHFGLFAACPENTYVKFFHREVFDVGVEFESTVSGYPNGVIETEMAVRPAPGVSSGRRYYRMGTGAFLTSTPDYLEGAALEYPKGTVLASTLMGAFVPRLLASEGTVPPGFPECANAFGLWSGEPDGSIGLYCVPFSATIDGQPAPGPHALITGHPASDPPPIHPGSILHLNAMDYSNNTTPAMASTVSIRAFWACSFMADIPQLGLPVEVTFQTQPPSQTVNVGGQAHFDVSVQGMPPLRYQWQKDDIDLPGARQAFLDIPVSSAAQAGGYRVVVRNPAGSRTSAMAMLAVNRSPTDLLLSNTSVVEGQPPNSTVGQFSTEDPDAGGSFSYTLIPGEGSGDNASFNINGDLLRTSVTFDFESKAGYSIRLRSTDQNGLWIEKPFVISVLDVFEPTGYSIGNRVFADDGSRGGLARNGVQDGAELGIAVVALKLFAADEAGMPTGGVLASATTDASGYYRLDGVPAGNYVVVVDLIASPALAGLTSSPGFNADLSVSADRSDHGQDWVLDGASVVPGGTPSVAFAVGGIMPTGELDVSGVAAGAHGPTGDLSDTLVLDFAFASALPTATVLDYFRADALSSNVVSIRWRTLVEVDVIGFYVERASRDDTWHRVGDGLVPAAGVGMSADYELVDHEASGGSAPRYRLLLVDTGGRQSVSAETALAPKLMLEAAGNLGSLRITVSGAAGSTADLEASDSLRDGVWELVQSLVLDCDGTATLRVKPDDSGPSRFFRAVQR